LTLLLLAGCAVPVLAQGFDARIDRGEALAASLCASCHAIRATGASPHIGAPAFRSIEERVDLDSFVERLRQGLSSAHDDMPTFRFSRDDARAMVAYLRSIQSR
jgi:mono/diheme cytochrome c family protein